MKTIALIGGGSVRTLYFVESLLKFCGRLQIGELRIMDIDPERLRVFGGMSLHMAKAAGSRLKIVLSEDFREAVRGCDYVVTTIRVGQDEMRCGDERIALDLGLIGQETTGAGGFSYALRSVSVMLGYMKTLREVNPDAWVFNFTNPSGLVTQALYDAGYDRIAGICDNASGLKIELSKALEVGAGDLTVRAYGLNHLSWVNAVQIGGTDILPRLMDSDSFVENFHPFGYFDRDLVRTLGEIPNGYLYYFYHRERALENMLRAPKSRGEAILAINTEMRRALSLIDVERAPEQAFRVFREHMQKREGSYMSMELGGGKEKQKPFDPRTLGIPELSGHGPLTDVYEGYAGVVFNYIESLTEDKAIDLAVNVPCGNAVPGMRPDDVAEVTCEVSAKGAVPYTFAPPPESNLLLMQTVKRYEKLTVEAIREKSMTPAIEALTIHPLVGSYSLAKELVRRYCKHNISYIGEWRM